MKLMCAPRLELNYALTSRLKLTGMAQHSQKPVDEQSFYSGFILSDSRTISSGYVDYDTGSDRSVNMSLQYSRPLKSLFAHISATKSWQEGSRMSNQSFIGDYIVRTSLPFHSSATSSTLSGGVSKGLAFLRGMVKVDASYRRSDAVMYMNEVATPYTSTVWEVSPRVTTTPASWCNFEYSLSYANNRMRVESASSGNTAQRLWQTLSGNIQPFESVRIQTTGQHYLNIQQGRDSKSVLLADVGITYCMKNGLEFNLNVRNIMNQQTYAYTVFNGPSSIYSSYVIRPRNVIGSMYFRF